jgi:glucokinase
MVKALIDPLIDRAKTDKILVKGVGIGLPGKEDKNTGKIYVTPNLPFIEGQPVGKLIETTIGMPVALDNDACTFTRAETLIGAAKGFKNVFGLTLGTGIGGSWWINNEIYHGAHNAAGQPGNIIIDLSSGMDFEKSFQKLTQNNTMLMAMEAYRGDALAEKTLEEFGRNLGVLIANIINLIDPDVFVIGGSVIKSGDLFLSAVKKAVKEYCASPVAAKKVKILTSKLGENAGAIGAAMLVQNA